MTPDDLLTRPEICREFARDKRTVERRLIGLEPAKIERRGSLLIRRWRRADIEQRMLERSAADELAFQLERLAAARADRMEIERGLRNGTLCELDVLCAQLAERFGNARAKLLSAPARLAPEIVVINATRSQKDALAARMQLLKGVLVEVFAELEMPTFLQRHDA